MHFHTPETHGHIGPKADILTKKWTFWHFACRFVHFSGSGPGFAIPLGGSDKELRE